jgi:hypothetical protein
VLLDREPDTRARRFLRVAARLHAALGQLELALAAVPSLTTGTPPAALLTLIDGADRWPWWGCSDSGGLGTEMGAPLVTLTARGGLRLPPLPVALRLPTRDSS